MQEKLNLYRCNICKNVVQMAVSGGGELVCCGEKMELLKENEVEKNDPHYAHVEKISDSEKRIFFHHEMTKEHHIEFMEAISYDKKYVKRKYFEIGEKPELILKCNCNDGFYVITYCNIHNVCKTKVDKDK